MALSDAFYQKIVSDIAPLFDELGTTYTVRTEGVYDPDDMETPVGSERTVAGILANQKEVNSLSAIAFPVTETSAGWIGRRALILRADAAPEAGEEVEIDGEWHPLANVTEVKPGDIVVLYILGLAR